MIMVVMHVSLQELIFTRFLEFERARAESKSKLEFFR